MQCKSITYSTTSILTTLGMIISMITIITLRGY